MSIIKVKNLHQRCFLYLPPRLKGKHILFLIMNHHKTRIPYIYGYVDERGDVIKGWMINIRMRSCVNPNVIRAIQSVDGEILEFVYGVNRKDVQDVYQLNASECGWEITRENRASPVLIQTYILDEWRTILEIEGMKVEPKPQPAVLHIHQPQPQPTHFPNNVCTRDIVVFDDIFNNPHIMRQNVLAQQGNLMGEEIKSFIENLLGAKIKSFSIQTESNIAEDLIGVSGSITGSNLYYANIFLTPDAPLQSGITFFKSRKNNSRKFTPGVHKSEERDMTQFDLVDRIGNVFNRLVIWKAELLHSPSCYFGNNKDNGRLVQKITFELY